MDCVCRVAPWEGGMRSEACLPHSVWGGVGGQWEDLPTTASRGRGESWEPSRGDAGLPLLLALTGNKGAVGVSFMFNGTSFGFVNCHLTSGNEKTAR